MRASLLLVLAACTHHKNLVEAHEVDGEVELENYRGQKVKAVAVKNGPGRVSFVAKSGFVPSPEAIKEITDTQHGRGALEGLGIGAAIGVGVGAIAGAASGDDECSGGGDECPLFTLTAGEKAILGGIVLGAVGGAIGFVIGATTGSTIIYRREGSQTTIQAIAPRGSAVGVTVSF